MSNQNKIRLALIKHLKSLDSQFETSFPNVRFTPKPDTPYQVVWVVPSKTLNPTYGGSYHRENGLLRVNLHYPAWKGEGSAVVKAETIQTHFRRGLTIVDGDVKVDITNTPSIGEGRLEEDRWVIPVRVEWISHCV